MDGDVGTCIGLALAAVRRADILARKTVGFEEEADLLESARRAVGQAAETYVDRCGVKGSWLFEKMLAVGNAEEIEVVRLLLDMMPRVMEVAANRPSTELVHSTAMAVLQGVIRLGRAWCSARGLQPADVDARLGDSKFYKSGGV